MADKDLLIEFDLTKLNDAIKALQGVGKAGQAAGNSLNASMRGGGAGGKGTGGGTPLQQARAAAQAQIYAAKVATAQQNQQSRAQINAAKVATAQARAQKAMNPKGPPSFAKRLDTFARSTRFGAGGLEPLVGRTADLFGGEIGELLGPIGLLAGAALTAAKTVKEFSDAERDAVLGMNQNRLTTGATPAEAGILSSLGNALPGKPDLSAAARAYRDRTSILSNDPFAIGVANKFGTPTQPQKLGGPSDDAKGYLSFLRGLRADKTDAEAKRDADNAGDPGALSVRAMNKRDFDSLVASGAKTGEAMNGPAAVRAAARNAASQQRLDDTVDRMKVGPGTAVSKWFTRHGNEANNILNDRNPDDDGLGGKAAPGGNPYGRGGSPLHSPDIRYAAATPRARRVMEKVMASEATGGSKEHTEAVKALTAVMKQNVLYYGTFGNASRGDFRGAEMGGQALQKAMASDRRGFALGAF